MRKKIWKMVSLLMSSVMLFTSVNTMALAGEIADASELVAEESEAVEYGLSNPVVKNGVVTWDCVYFGNYNGSAIKWRVLNVEGDDAFLLADNGLIETEYNATNVAVTWETCTLRSWLNGYSASANVCGDDYTSDNFIKSAFNDSEYLAINITKVVNVDNPDYIKGVGGNNTSDKVFLLSIDEAENTSYGFISNTSRTIEAKTYWWLRSPGCVSNWASYVATSGTFYLDGNEVNATFPAVRPALHLNLSSSTVWSYAGTVASDGIVKEPHTVSFNAMGGALASEEVYRTVLTGTELGVLPIPELSTKCFAGWYTDKIAGDKVEASFIADKDITLYAHWNNEHTKAVDITAKAPTCTENGATEGAHCSVCNKELSTSKVIEATGHTEVILAAVSANCTDAGLTEGKKCSVCDKIIEAQETVSANGHSTVTIPGYKATCSANGLTDGQECSVCGEILKAQEVISNSEEYHNWVVVTEAIASTCSQNGTAAVEKCSICGQKRGGDILDKSQHTWSTISANEATCTVSGNTLGRECLVCHEKEGAELIPAKGHSIVTDPAKPATCTVSGNEAGAHCSVCGCVIKATTEIAALGHNPVTDKAVSSNCTETGLTEGSHCDRCGEILVKQETVAAKGHILSAVSANAATCTKMGRQAGKVCTECDYTEGLEIIPALGHEEITIKGKTPTCSENGYTDEVKCGRCGLIFNGAKPLPKAAHNTDIKLEGTAPTCSENGISDGYKCSVCNTIVIAQKEIPALGHTGEGFKGATAPSCTVSGNTGTGTCSRCHATLSANQIIPALGHKMVSDNSVDPTCEKAGHTGAVHCERCDYVETPAVSIPALGHKAVSDNAVAATCNATGLTEGSHCSVCGKILVAQTVTDKLTHNHVTTVTAKAATCTEAGRTEGWYCDNCGYEVKSEVIKALGHNIVKDKAVVATCTESGLTEGEHCSRCDYVKAQVTVAALGHDYADVFTVDKAATCQEAGSKSHHCRRCEAKKDVTEIEQLKHIWDEGKITKEPNLKFDGIKTYTCTLCNQTREELLPKILPEPEKEVVKTEVETKEDGTKVTTETHKDGTITEKTEIELPDGMKDTSVQKIEIVADKDDKDTSDKEAKYSVSIEQTGNATITQDVLDLVKNQIADKKDVKAKKVVVDLTVVTKDEQGNEYSVTASSKDLKKNAKLTVYAIDPVTGELILVDASSKACKFDKKTGLSLPELSGTNDYKLLSSSQASKALKDILKTVQLKNAKVDSAVGGTVKVELLTKADDEKGLNLNNLEKMEILKSKKYTVNEETNEITLADNVKKGTVSVKVKVTLKNGKTKTLTMKVKVIK